ncbi:unnamed protein product, partial [Symbiodinium pilosum]
VRDYWMKQDRSWTDATEDWAYCVPLRIYGDGAEFTRLLPALIQIICMIAPLGAATTMKSRFMLSCINMMYHKDDSRQKILRVIQWSFEALGRL